MTMLDTPQAVFVAWQQPESRRYFPVGRLESGTGPESARYEFAYIQGALDAAKEGFQPFLAFPELDRVYRSEELFPFFANRVMSRSRSDFADCVKRLGLDPETADEMSILARSGGVRATDSVELFPMPTFDSAAGCYRTHFLMHGFRHLEPDEQKRVLRLKQNERLELVPEPTNPNDPKAIRLKTCDASFVGYVPRYVLEDVWALADACSYIDVYVEHVNPPPSPIQQRLLCRMASCWPDGFSPFSSSTYQPISSTGESSTAS